MWCCKSNAAVEGNHRHLPKLARQEEDTDSAAPTNNNSEDGGSEVMANVQDITYSNFILHQLSNNKEVSFSATDRNDNYTLQKQEHQSVIQRQENTVVVSYDDDDDNITTVYSEDTPLPNTTLKRNLSTTSLAHCSTRIDSRSSRISGVIKSEEKTRNDGPPLSNSYVLLPDVPQRGYEAIGWVRYPERDKWIPTKPYELGTLVWYRYVSPSMKFKWYIPGQITNYILSGDIVEGYEIKVDCEDHILERHEPRITSILKNAPPENTMLRWDEHIPLCPVDGIDVAETQQQNHSAEKSLELARIKYGHDFGFQGAKQNGYGPEMWGITMEQINDICKHPKYDETMSMYDVVNKIVKPTTAGTGMSYALYCNKQAPIRARVMVSHAWQENFKQFVEALAGSEIEGPFWVCALSIYQNEDLPNVTIQKQLGPSPSSGPFSTVLKQADRMVAIMTDSCDIYTRLWCVYEIFIAITLNVPVSLASFNEITTSGGSSDAMYTNVVLDSSSDVVTTSAAVCGNQYDQDMIQKEVLEKVGGFEVIDDAVMWVRIKALIDGMQTAKVKMTMETTVYRPIGSCSASNIATRQNAAIASAIQVWNDAKAKRSAKDRSDWKESKAFGVNKGDSETSKGMLSKFRNKIFNCGHMMCNF